MRTAAAEAGTTTRAVYSLFGSKEGLVAAVAQTAFEYLYDEIDRLPKSDDPAADLIAIGTEAVRRLALDHPGLFRIAFQPRRRAARRPRSRRRAREGLGSAPGRRPAPEGRGLLGTKPVSDAAREINAMWEGLANAELRGEVLRIMPKGEEQRGMA